MQSVATTNELLRLFAPKRVACRTPYGPIVSNGREGSTMKFIHIPNELQALYVTPKGKDNRSHWVIRSLIERVALLEAALVEIRDPARFDHDGDQSVVHSLPLHREHCRVCIADDVLCVGVFSTDSSGLDGFVVSVPAISERSEYVYE